MKTLKIDNIEKADFSVLAINSHIKSYTLCWQINNKLKTYFVKAENHSPQNNTNQTFERFTYKDIKNESQYDIISNLSSEGYLLNTHKSVNYFLKIQNKLWTGEKEIFINKLNEIPEILLIFELNLVKINSLTPFILDDK